MRYFFYNLLILFLTSNLYAQYQYNEILFVPWGKDTNKSGLIHTPDGHYGPMSFSVNRDSVFLLDSQNKRLKIFKDKKVVHQLDLPRNNAEDFLYKSDKRYYFLSDNKILEYSQHKQVNTFRPKSGMNSINALHETLNGDAYGVLNDGNRIQLFKNIHQTSTTKQADQPDVKIRKKDWQTINILLNDENAFDITSGQPNLGSCKFLGCTQTGNLYIYIETIIRHVPLQIKRDIRLYTQNGEVKAIFEIPAHTYTYTFKEFYIDDNGNLFHMLSLKDGIHIIGWLQTKSTAPSVQTYKYPESLLKFDNDNPDNEKSDLIPTQSKKNAKNEEELVTVLENISRDEALAIAKSYVQHEWIASADNLTNGEIVDPYGQTIKTPEWIVVGTNYKIPYKWGGFSTLEQFDQGLLNGKFAGDIMTDKSSGSSSCVGVDCSGFVSRCWKLDTQYSTRMMDDYIAQPYSTWFDLLPADAIHREGHVRLFVDFNQNGTLLVVEATAKGTFWRTGYFSYTLSDLQTYTPRYYINMEGTPASIPQPELQYIIYGENVQVDYNISDIESISKFQIYSKTDDTDWEQILSADVDQTTLAFPVQAGKIQYYQVKSVSAEDNVSESFPSDTYGYYDSGSEHKVLIVDGFDRTTGSYPFSYHSFAMTTGQALAGLACSFETVSNEAVISGQVKLEDYDGVIWLLGDESTLDTTFNHQEQTLVTSYLQQGGNLFISGSEIAWDLDYKGTTNDKNFLHDYLKTAYKQDDAGNYTIVGQQETIFEGITLNYDNGTHNVYEEDYPDAFNTTNGSYAALKYGNGLIAATAYEGLVPGGTKDAAILVLGIPVETIYQEAHRINLLKKVLDFWQIDYIAVSEKQSHNPQRFALYQNYPNPFNSSTTISYQIARGDYVELKVYNVLGEEVRTLTDGYQSAGEHFIHWNGSDNHGNQLSSGMYIYHLKTGIYDKHCKMLLIQ